MALYATNGAKLHIGGALAQKSTDFVQADFTSQVWTEIHELESLGTVGDTASEVSIDIIGEARTKRLKGTRNAGTMEVVCGLDPADTGQTAAVAAEKTILDYAFKLVLNDAPAGGTPSERYFIAKVSSAAEVFDSANSVTKLQLSLWVNSNVVKVNAAPGGG